jgi:hypothetical protein
VYLDQVCTCTYVTHALLRAIRVGYDPLLFAMMKRLHLTNTRIRILHCCRWRRQHLSVALIRHTTIQLVAAHIGNLATPHSFGRHGDRLPLPPPRPQREQ